MHIWSIKAVKKELIQNRLSEQDSYRYLFGIIFYYSVLISIAGLIGSDEHGKWDYVGAVLDFGIPIIGIWLAFSANGGKNGSRFLERYISLSFVLGFRFWVFGVFVMLIVIIGLLFFDEGDVAFESDGLWVFVISFVNIVYYILLIRGISDVASHASFKTD